MDFLCEKILMCFKCKFQLVLLIDNLNQWIKLFGFIDSSCYSSINGCNMVVKVLKLWKFVIGKDEKNY